MLNGLRIREDDMEYREIQISGRVVLVLDPDEIYTPALVISGKIRADRSGRRMGNLTSTYDCATGTGMVDDEIALTVKEMEKLEQCEDLVEEYISYARRDPEWNGHFS
jgi:hypothetical protein